MNTALLSALRRSVDVQWGGTGRIYGTTKKKALPDNLPARARVVLLHQRSKLPVRQTWSDSQTGAFEFRNVDATQKWLVLAEDASGMMRPVAASMLVAEG